MVERRWTGRAAVEADLPATARLMEECYGAGHRTADPRFLRHQYFESPLGEAISYVAVAADGELVGAYSLVPWPFSFGGRVAQGTLSLNSATSPRFQKQGIFVGLARLAYAEAARRGAVGVLGFPNQNSRHGLVSSLGWTELGQMRAFVRPRRLGSLVASVRARGGWERNAGEARAGWMARAVDAASRGLFRLGARAGELGAVAEGAADGLTPLGRPFEIGYSPEFVRWRYGDNPQFGYEVVRAGGAAVVCRHGTLWGARTTLLVEFAGARSVASLTAAIRAACRRAADRDSAQVMTLVSPGHPAISALWRAPLVPVPNQLLPHGAYACYLPLGGRSTPPRFETWAIAVGAYDAG